MKILNYDDRVEYAQKEIVDAAMRWDRAIELNHAAGPEGGALRRSIKAYVVMANIETSDDLTDSLIEGLASAIGHEACDYTEKATSEEIALHLLLVQRNEGPLRSCGDPVIKGKPTPVEQGTALENIGKAILLLHEIAETHGEGPDRDTAEWMADRLRSEIGDPS